MAVSQQVAPWRRPVKTAVHQAVLDGRVHQVRLLVSTHGVNVDSKDVFGRTPLMLACLLENEEDGLKMVKIFLKAGAFVNVKDNSNRTAISYACMKGRQDIVAKFLREDMLDINSADNDGNTPLCHAALCGNPNLVRQLTHVLVSFGLSVDTRNRLGYTPLILACKYGHYVSAHIILTLGHGSPTLRDNEFFLNAYEWVARSTELRHSLNLNRSRAVPIFPRFTRENTLYHQSSVVAAVCKHTKPVSHPLGQSLDVALQLPDVFSYFPVEKPMESSIDGGDARQVLLKAIDDVIYANQARLRPASRVSSAWTRSSYPGTPKLLAMVRKEKVNSTPSVVPDLRTLFKLYSDQYQPPITYRARKGLTSTTGDPGTADVSPRKLCGDRAENPPLSSSWAPDENRGLVET